MSIELKGKLELDRNRGVIYFHLSEREDIDRLQAVTILRLSNLPKSEVNSLMDFRFGNTNELQVRALLTAIKECNFVKEHEDAEGGKRCPCNFCQSYYRLKETLDE